MLLRRLGGLFSVDQSAPSPSPALLATHLITARTLDSPLLLFNTDSKIEPDKLVSDHLDSVLHVMNEKCRVRDSVSAYDPNQEGATAEFPWLPGYIIKLEAERRVYLGGRIKEYVREKNLDLILVPDQTLYPIPATHHHLTELRYLCIAKKIEGSQGREIPINLAQAKQLVELIKADLISDLKWRNVVHCHGQIALIDTAPFGGGVRWALSALLEQNRLDSDAKKLIAKTIKSCPGGGMGGYRR